MKRDHTGDRLESLGLGYRPAIRCAMPWANDALLLRDSNVRTARPKPSPWLPATLGGP